MRLIAVELGVVESTVSRQLSKAGVRRRPSPRKMPGVTDSEIVRLRLEGKLWREIAAEVGMSRNGVYSRRRRLKLSGKL